MPEKDILAVLNDKVSEVIARLERIEQRQIKTTEMVETVKETEAAPLGSFATTDRGEEKKK